jgi:hypothetical protein
MTPLDQDARREGRKAMEKSLTAAARMRRRFKAGRPAKIRNDALTPLQAINRLVNEADKARGLMRDEGLEPDDVRCALIFCTPEVPGLEEVVRYRWLPAPGETRNIFSAFDDLDRDDALFLGILWYQQDREAEGEDRHTVWVTQFMGGSKAEQMLYAARDHFRRGGHKAQDN